MTTKDKAAMIMQKVAAARMQKAASARILQKVAEARQTISSNTMFSSAYEAGFRKAAEAYGVDPEELVKFAGPWLGALRALGRLGGRFANTVGQNMRLGAKTIGQGFLNGARTNAKILGDIGKGFLNGTRYAGQGLVTGHVGQGLHDGARAMGLGLGRGARTISQTVRNGYNGARSVGNSFFSGIRRGFNGL